MLSALVIGALVCTLITSTALTSSGYAAAPTPSSAQVSGPTPSSTHAAAPTPSSASQPAPSAGQATNPVQSATPTPSARPALPAATKDTTPPGPVTGLGLTGNTISSVTLGWTDPTDADLAHVVIRRAAGSTAPAAGQGTLVATLGAKATSYTDKSLASATAYSYALFAEDKTGNLSSAATVTAYTAATDAHTGLRGTLTDSAGKASATCWCTSGSATATRPTPPPAAPARTR